MENFINFNFDNLLNKKETLSIFSEKTFGIFCKSGIYMIQNLINGKCYVGSTVNLNKRKKEHFKKLKNGQHDNNKLKKSANKHGIENFKFVVLEYVENKENLLKIEQFYIDKFDAIKNGYNICPTAGNTSGREVSKETRKLMSKLFSGENNPMFGRVHSEETKKKIGIKSKQKIMSLEFKQKMSDRIKGVNHPNFGKKFSNETKKKISLSNMDNKNFLRKKHSEETKQKMSESHKGEKAYNYGLKASQKIKDKMSESSPRKQKSHCKWGHEFTEENTYISVRKNNGRMVRQCKICTRTKALKNYYSKKLMDKYE